MPNNGMDGMEGMSQGGGGGEVCFPFNVRDRHPLPPILASTQLHSKLLYRNRIFFFSSNRLLFKIRFFFFKNHPLPLASPQKGWN